MNVLFRFQDVLKIVNDGFMTLKTNVSKPQRASYCELRKKDEKDLFLIYQCLDLNIFEKIIAQETTKDVWYTLKKL